MANSDLVVFVAEKTSSSPPDGREIVWALLLLADRVLGFLILATLDFLVKLLANLALTGMAAYEWSPTYFWSVWLPAVVCFYGSWVVWVARVAVPWVFCLVWKVVLRRFALGWLLELTAAYLLRGRRAPPAVLQAGGNVMGVVTSVAHARGAAFAQAVSVTHASVASGGLTPLRVRSRSRWVRALEGYLGGRPGLVGRLVKGRWVPDLPDGKRPASADALLALIDGESKLLGGGVLPTDPAEHEVFLVVETEAGRLVIVPRLLARLSQYACFRPRTPELLAGLRARANEWFKEKSVLPEAAALVLPDTVELAFSETAPERLARERLDAKLVPPSLQ